MKKSRGWPLPLGVTTTKDYWNFSVAVPKGETCRLLLYRAGEMRPCISYDMEAVLGEIHAITLTELDGTDYEYNYEIDGEVKVDPYVRRLTGRCVWGKPEKQDAHEVRGILETETYDWENDKLPSHANSDVVAYNLHVRGFTKDPYSQVSAKGTFEGVIEKLPYLKELGINQIHCMPVYEFEERGRVPNYWGYGEAYYFAPKSAYSAYGNGVISLKNMVKACHEAGIEVVLEMPFEGNVSVMEAIECLRYYRMEYHVDGFILNPCLEASRAAFSDPALKDTKLLVHRTDFQDIMRRFLKGDEGMIEAVMYWLRHLGGEEGIFNYITSHTGFTLNDLVSYDGKHNEANGENNQDGPDYNYSWNCGAEGPSRKKAVCALRNRQIKNALFLVLLAQGTPCLLAGDEFGNSQRGNNNVYCQDNPTGWVNWRGLKSNREQWEFVKELIHLRKTYRVFHPEEEMNGMDKVGCGVPDVSYHGENAWRVQSEVSSRQLGIYYCGAKDGRTDCFVIYNMHWLAHTFALPALPKGKSWYRVASTDEGVLREPAPMKEQKALEVDARTIVVLVGK